MSDSDTSSVITIVAIIPPAAGRVDDVRKHLIKLAEGAKTEAGALRYELAEQANPAGEPEFVVIEDYKDQAALDEHRNSDHFKAFFAAAQSEGLLREGTAIKELKKFGGFSSK